MKTITDETIWEIISITAQVAKDVVWGYDTDLGTKEEVIQEARDIINKAENKEEQPNDLPNTHNFMIDDGEIFFQKKGDGYPRVWFNLGAEIKFKG